MLRNECKIKGPEGSDHESPGGSSATTPPLACGEGAGGGRTPPLACGEASGGGRTPPLACGVERRAPPSLEAMSACSGEEGGDAPREGGRGALTPGWPALTPTGSGRSMMLLWRYALVCDSHQAPRGIFSRVEVQL